MSEFENILEEIKKNVSKKEYSKLKKLLMNKDKNLMKIIKNFQKNKDFDKLISKLIKLVNSKEEDDKSENSEKTNKKQKAKNEYNDKDLKKIEKNIINSLKNKDTSVDIYYIAKYDLQKLNKEEKISLFNKKYKLKLDSIINKDNYKIPKKNISIIKKYYSEYINKKIKKDFDENENILYEGLLEQEEDNNYILKFYKDFLKHKNINELKNNIKQIIKETVERIQEGEGEEEEEDDEDDDGEEAGKTKNEGKTLIKEENEEEEEEEDEEGEEEDEKDKNDENKSSSNKSSNNDNDNIIILKDDNKDRAVNLLNDNYRKINNFNYNNNDNSNNDKNKEDSKDKNKGDDQNLGLGFVVVKQKKSLKGEENNNNLPKENNEENKQNESSVSTNNPNKKLNQFIQQIEHLKKIDDIKGTIIEAINNNNKYIMDLFQKFQKNKFCLNPKSLNAVYKQIKENPEINSKGNEFKSLITGVPNITGNIQEFLCYEFNNQNSELETYYNIYEDNKEKNEFIESIELFLKKPNNKKLLQNFNLNSIKKEIEPKLSLKNGNLIEKSKEIIRIFRKYNLFSEKEFNIMQKSLKSGENIITAAFQVLFDNKDFDEFHETITLAIGNQIKKGGNKK